MYRLRRYVESVGLADTEAHRRYLWLSNYSWLLSLRFYSGIFSSVSKLICIHSVINNLKIHVQRHRKERGRL